MWLADHPTDPVAGLTPPPALTPAPTRRCRSTIAAIGRMKAGPERELAERYLDRVDKAGRRLGLSLAVREFPESRAALRRRPQGRRRPPRCSPPCRRAPRSSPSTRAARTSTAAPLPRRIAGWRDDGVADLAFAIGGADGLGADAAASRADAAPRASAP